MTSLKLALSATLLAIALLASACAKPQSIFSDTPTAQAPPADIQVLEADVIIVNGRHLRLVDAVAPQPAPHASCIAEALAAHQGRLRLKELSQGVQRVQVVAAGGVDSYGRTRAHVLFDGHDPTQSLIEDGLAVAPGDKPVDWCGPLADAPPQARHIAMLSQSGF